MTLAALAPIAALELPFPKAARSRSSASAFYPGLLGLLIIAALIDPEQRVLKIGTLLYVGAYVAAYRAPDRRRAPTSTGSGRCSPARSPRACSPAARGAGGSSCWCSHPSCSTGRSTRRCRTSPRPSPTRPPRPPTTRRCSPSCERSTSATPRARARIEVVPTSDHWEAVLGRRTRRDRPRLGAPAGQLPQRPLLRRINPADADRAITPGSPSRRSPTWRCPMRRWTTPGPPRHASCSGPSPRDRRHRGARVRRRLGATCGKSGARRTGACSPCSTRARSPNHPPCSPQLQSDSFTADGSTAGPLSRAGSLHPLLDGLRRARVRAAKHPADGPGCRPTARAACTSRSTSRCARVLGGGARCR